jgi:tetratricopeptide (TPR) repeat protein
MRTFWPATATLIALVLSTCAWAAGPTKGGLTDPVALMDAGHFKQARALVEPRYRSNPNNAETLYLEARLKAAFGASDEAIKLAERALVLDDRNVYYHGALASLLADKAMNASFVDQILLAPKVKRHLDDAFALDPHNWHCLDGMVQFYLAAPGILGGDKRKAQQLADQAVKDDPVHGWLMQGRVAQASKDLAREEQAYLSAVKAAPNDYDALATLADFYLRDTVKRYADAEKYARAAILLDSGRTPAYSVLAALLVHQRRFGELDQLLGDADRSVPDDLTPFFIAARTLLLDGQDFDDAERYLRKYLTQEPEGNAPRHAFAHWRLGQLYQKSGKTEQARAEYELCLRQEPGFDPAKKDLKSLK